MKVYLACFHAIDYDDTFGIYSSLDAAIARLNKEAKYYRGKFQDAVLYAIPYVVDDPYADIDEDDGFEMDIE